MRESRTDGQHYHALLSSLSKCLRKKLKKKIRNKILFKSLKFVKNQEQESLNFKYSKFHKGTRFKVPKFNIILPFIFWNSLFPASNWIFAYNAKKLKINEYQQTGTLWIFWFNSISKKLNLNVNILINI